MAVKTRKLQTVSLTTNTGDLKTETEIVFPLLTDTGPGRGTIVSATLTVTAMKSYSSLYTLALSYGGIVLATMPNPGVFESIRSVTSPLESIDPRLLTDAAESIVLTIKGSGSGNKCNLRETCYLSLEIVYEEPEEPRNVFYRSGSAWLPCEVKYYTGSAWLPCKTNYSPDGQTFQ